MIRLSKAESARLAARLGIVPPSKAKRSLNKLESRYGAHLAILKAAGEIINFGFEEIKLKIGVGVCWYTPDFHVVTESGLEFHETKGFFRDDAKVKIKAAALKYPHFRFIVVRQNGDGWDWELIA